MSFGVTARSSGAEALGELLDQADKALYASKQGGRNRVTNWIDIAPEPERKGTVLEVSNVERENPSQEGMPLQAEEMEPLAKRDPLTGVANRSAFLEWATQELAAARTRSTSFCCVMSDIDRLERINEKYGHQMGDDVIRRVAGLFASQLRSSDAVCRYGGEEFCIVLPGATIEVAMRVAERLREQVGAPRFARVPLTMSFGVVSSSTGAGTLAELLEQADAALAASKEAGRNRVSRWDDVAGA